MITKRHHLLIAIIVLIVFSASVTLVVVSVRYRENYNLTNVVNVNSIIGRLRSVFTTINDFPGSVGRDMVFLRTISSLSAFYGDSSNKSWRQLHQDMQGFIDGNEAYDEIVVYKEGCVLTVRRVSQDDGNTFCGAFDSELQNVVSHVKGLSFGGVYVSKLIDYPRVVNGKKSTIPSIIYGTKVLVPNSKNGVLIAVINANYFLKDIRNLQRPGGKVFLLNIDGSYIANSDKTKEKLNGSSTNFYTDYPLVQKNILSNFHVRKFETKNRVFTFMHIIPTTNNFALYDSMPNELKKQNSNSYWVMASVSGKNGSGVWWLSESYVTDVMVILIMHILVIVALYIAIFPTKTLKDLFDSESLVEKQNN